MATLGVHIAQVVENLDPQNEGRIQVRCLTLFGEGESNWIDACTPAGISTIPRINTNVLIIAENEDPRFCHYLGIAHAEVARYPKLLGELGEMEIPFNPALPGEQLTIKCGDKYIHFDNITKTITIKADTIQVYGNLKVSGNITVGGKIEATGSITSIAGDVIATGISLRTHTHQYVPGIFGSAATSVPS